MTSLLAGASVADITPPPGLRLSGFAGRPGPATGMRDPLHASALYLEAAGKGAIILALDLVGLEPEDDLSLRNAIAARTGVGVDCVLVACSHTHSAPATMKLRATGAKEHTYTKTVLEQAANAAAEARSRAVDGMAQRGAGVCLANVNRRLPTAQGIALATNVGGPCDHTCRVIRIDSAAGPAAALVQFEMHPVALGGGNLRYSPDWVGTMRAEVEAALGCPVIFLQGCCGDINPRTRGEEGCVAVGLDAAGSVLSTHLEEFDVSEIRGAAAVASLPVRPLPDDAALQRVSASASSTLKDVGDDPTKIAARHIAEADVEWSAACQAIRSGGSEVDHLDARVSALRLGDVTLVGLPGEIFSEIGAAVRQRVPGAWSVGYSNGNLGYLYTDAALEEGGYEVNVAYRLYGEYQADAGTASALIEAAVRAAA